MLVSSVSLFREKRSQELLKKGLTRNNVNFVRLYTPHLKDASKNAPPTPPNKHTASASYFPSNKHTVSAGYFNLTLATKRLRKACRPFLLPWILGTFIPQKSSKVAPFSWYDSATLFQSFQCHRVVFPF